MNLWTKLKWLKFLNDAVKIFEKEKVNMKDWKTTVQAILTTIMTLSTALLASGLVSAKYSGIVIAISGCAKIWVGVIQKDGVPTDLIKTGSIIILVTMIAVGTVSTAQAQTSPVAGDYVGVGISGNPGATPIIAAGGFYCRALDDSNCALLTVDALPTTDPVFSIRTNVGAGIGHKFATFNDKRIEVWGTAGAGLTYTSENLGWNFQSGGLVSYQFLKDNPHWRVFVAARLEKASVGNDGYNVAGSGGISYRF